MCLDVCKQESQQILRRLRDGDLTVTESLIMLDSVIAAALRDIKPDEIKSLKLLMLENDKIVRQESNRRAG